MISFANDASLRYSAQSAAVLPKIFSVNSEDGTIWRRIKFLTANQWRQTVNSHRDGNLVSKFCCDNVMQKVGKKFSEHCSARNNQVLIGGNFLPEVSFSRFSFRASVMAQFDEPIFDRNYLFQRSAGVRWNFSITQVFCLIPWLICRSINHTRGYPQFLTDAIRRNDRFLKVFLSSLPDFFKCRNPFSTELVQFWWVLGPFCTVTKMGLEIFIFLRFPALSEPPWWVFHEPHSGVLPRGP